jgi:hypothetical protein
MLYLGWAGRVGGGCGNVCNTNLASSSEIGAGIADPLHKWAKLSDGKYFRERYHTLKISEISK